jgi:hypothetical protein
VRRHQPKICESQVGGEFFARLRRRHPLDQTGIGFAEKSFAKWLRENDALIVKKSVEAYARLFKMPPYVPDKGIEKRHKDLATRRAVAKEFFNRPELFRDNGPLERALSRS